MKKSLLCMTLIALLSVSCASNKESSTSSAKSESSQVKTSSVASSVAPSTSQAESSTVSHSGDGGPVLEKPSDSSVKESDVTSSEEISVEESPVESSLEESEASSSSSKGDGSLSLSDVLTWLNTIDSSDVTKVVYEEEVGVLAPVLSYVNDLRDTTDTNTIATLISDFATVRVVQNTPGMFVGGGTTSYTFYTSTDSYSITFYGGGFYDENDQYYSYKKNSFPSTFDDTWSEVYHSFMETFSYNNWMTAYQDDTILSIDVDSFMADVRFTDLSVAPNQEEAYESYKLVDSNDSTSVIRPLSDVEFSLTTSGGTTYHEIYNQDEVNFYDLFVGD